MTLSERLREAALSPRERRVADVVLGEPSAVAFGTVASVAAAAGVGNSTVMRFATAVGFDGFRALQDAVRGEVGGHLRQATQRVRQPRAGDPVDRALAVEMANLQATFAGIDRAHLEAASRRVAGARRVGVVAGDGASGIGRDLATQLEMLRGDVRLIDGGSVALSRGVTWLTREDVLIAIDTGRYEEAVVRACERAAGRNVPLVGVSDSHLSPIGAMARWSFVVADGGIGPFDSFAASLALLNLFVASVTDALGRSAVRHLDALDADWDAAGALRPED